MSGIAIKASHIRKTYRDYKSNLQKMKHMLILSGAGEKNNVFRDVSFEVSRGEKVGIITDKGIGKSTLLRIIAGILTPEKGSVEINGELTTILDYKCGFDSGLTVGDNYEIVCTLLGWSEEVMKEREAEILKFAELGDSREQLLRDVRGIGANRLGYAIHTYEKPDILLFDEKFTFGSKKQNSKYIKHLKKMLADPEITVLMAANRPKTMARFLTRGIVIVDGKVAFDGEYTEALEFLKANPEVVIEKTPEPKEEPVMDLDEKMSDEDEDGGDEDGGGEDGSGMD